MKNNIWLKKQSEFESTKQIHNESYVHYRIQ
jgi:hypothetical protein